MLTARPGISESLGVMPRESGASSNLQVMGCAPMEVVVTGSPAFAGDDAPLKHLFPAGRLVLASTQPIPAA